MGAILLPGAEHRLLPGKSKTLLDPRWITVHTMVWDLASCEHYFRQAGRPYSHFGTGPEGELRQWQDLRFRAASCLEGNPYSISWENADTGPGYPRWSGTDVPDFTDAQAETLIVGLSWCCHRFGIPKSAIATSCPHERGIGWHRLGVDPWRNTSCGLRWSSHRGKVCPGDRRIHQLVHEIIPAVSAPAPATPVSEEDDDMPTVLAWFQDPDKPDERHCYAISGRTAAWCPTHAAIDLQRYFGATWWGGDATKVFAPAEWRDLSLAIMNGPVANIGVTSPS